MILPAIQVILFCLAIGQLPRELPVAVYNPDHPPPTMTHYSQNVLDQFDPEYIHLVCLSNPYLRFKFISYLFIRNFMIRWRKPFIQWNHQKLGLQLSFRRTTLIGWTRELQVYSVLTNKSLMALQFVFMLI